MRKIIVAVLLVTMSVLAAGCALAEPNYDRGDPNQKKQSTVYIGGNGYTTIQCGYCGATYEQGRYQSCPQCGNSFGGRQRVIHAPGPYYYYPGYYEGQSDHRPFPNHYQGHSDQRPFPNYYQGQNGNGNTQMEQLLLEMLRKAVGK